MHTDAALFEIDEWLEIVPDDRDPMFMRMVVLRDISCCSPLSLLTLVKFSPAAVTAAARSPNPISVTLGSSSSAPTISFPEFPAVDADPLGINASGHGIFVWRADTTLRGTVQLDPSAIGRHAALCTTHGICQ